MGRNCMLDGLQPSKAFTLETRLDGTWVVRGHGKHERRAKEGIAHSNFAGDLKNME